MKSWKQKLALMLVCVMLLSVTGCAPASEGNSSGNGDVDDGQTQTENSGLPEVIQIGLDVSLTGNNAVTCEHFLHGAQLAVEEINAAGGIGGSTVELVTGDAQSTTAGCLSAYELLADQDVAGIIGPENTTMAVAAVDLVKEYGIPSFIPASGVDLMGGDNPTNWYRMLTADNVVTQAIAKFMVEELNYKKIAVIYDNGTYGIGCLEYFQAALAEYGIEPIGTYGFNQGDTDYTAQFLAARDDGAEVVMVFTPMSADAAVIVRQYAELGLEYQFFGSLQFSTSAVYQLAQDATNGIYCSQQFSTDASDVAQEFYDDYMEEYGYPADQFSAIGYDACYLLKLAIEAAETVEHAAVNEELHKISGYQGALALYEAEEDGDMFNTINIVKVDNGVYTKVA